VPTPMWQGNHGGIAPTIFCIRKFAKGE
jgi:hypothetical protein